MPVASIVRVAKPEDHQEVWRLLLQGHQENGCFTLAPDKVEYFIQRALHPDMIPPWDAGPRGAIGVIGPVGRLEGLVFVMIGEYWYSRDKHLEEYIVYVDPECRRSWHARALIQWMKDQSLALNIPLVTGVISNERTKAKCDLYNRSLPKVGEFFMFNAKGAVALSSASSAAAAVA